MIKALHSSSSTICLVGDSDQSIYGWRGADISNIMNFERDFQPAEILYLEQNYRSSQNILSCANDLIKHNARRYEKNLWTENPLGKRVQYKEYDNDLEEGQEVVREIEKAHQRGIAYENMAILYRTNAQSRVFEDQLIRRGIPYKVIGGLKFYDRKEIKDLIAYMNLLVNPRDDVAFIRIVNMPRRGIGEKSLVSLAEIAGKSSKSLYEVLKDPDLSRKLSMGERKKFRVFVDLMEEMKKYTEDSISTLARMVYSLSGYEEELNVKDHFENESRRENVEAFFQAIEDYEEETEEANLSDYLQNLSLMSQEDKTEDGTSQLELMTMHSAKGLEFPLVFLVGMEEGLFPSRRSLEEGNIEEERRLCYVAITRAEKELYLSGCRYRRIYGQNLPQIRSSFLEEMTSHLDISEEDIKEEPISPFFPRQQRVDQIRKRIERRKKEANKTSKASYQVGDKVMHRKFGQGMVVAVKDKEGDQEVVVAFDKKGLKTLIGKLAPMKKL